MPKTSWMRRASVQRCTEVSMRELKSECRCTRRCCSRASGMLAGTEMRAQSDNKRVASLQPYRDFLACAGFWKQVCVCGNVELFCVRDLKF